MFDVLKILIVFITILALLRLKWNIGYVLLIASGLLAALYMMPVQTIISTIRSTITDPITIKLFFALTFIRILELVLREKEVLSAMMATSRRLLKSKKALIISMPMLIGLLPSLGGAYFSAPMVEEATRGVKMSPEEKGFINYWFRHPWEYILPLYPGILLASAITKIELRNFILANAVYALLLFITGFMFSMRDLRAEERKPGRTEGVKHNEKASGLPHFRASGLFSFLPVSLVLMLVIVFDMELHYSLGIIILMLFAFYRLSPREIFRTFRHGFTLDVTVLIFGSMLFKFTMENSGSVVYLSRYFIEKGIPLLPVLLVLPFVSGLLTGLTVGFVGSTFPLLISLAGGVHLNQMTLAFAAGFTGVLMSPVHLCLVLTREYFKADVWGMYKRMLPAAGIIMTAALIEYLMLK